ncbi:unnamed protein product [Urochloa humidicola]
MSTTHVASMIVAVLLLVAMVTIVSSAPTPALVPAVAGERRSPPPSLVPFRPAWHGGRRRRQAFFHGRAAGGCMPRGFRVPPSAPSRYVNYHTLDAGVCGGGGRKP